MLAMVSRGCLAAFVMILASPPPSLARLPYRLETAFLLSYTSMDNCLPGCWVQAVASWFLVQRAMCWQRKQPSIASIQMTLQPNKGPRNLAPLIVGSVREDLQGVRIFVNKDQDRACAASAPSRPAASPGAATWSGVHLVVQGKGPTEVLRLETRRSITNGMKLKDT